MDIVLDKSFVQGASAKIIQELMNEHRLLMPEVLFMELMTTTDEERIECFKKFPATENPVDLIPSVGNLMGYEIEQNSPATPIRERKLDIRFEFNEKLKKESWGFTSNQTEAVKEWEKVVQSDIQGFITQSSLIKVWFPELIKHPKAVDVSLAESAMQEVSTNTNKMLEIYDQTHPNSFPKTEMINERWAVYRRLQVHLLYGIDYFRRYGAGNFRQHSKKLENYRLDINYVVTGVLSGALATNETKNYAMATFFQKLLPKGYLLTYSDKGIKEF